MKMKIGTKIFFNFDFFRAVKQPSSLEHPHFNFTFDLTPAVESHLHVDLPFVHVPPGEGHDRVDQRQLEGEVMALDVPLDGAFQGVVAPRLDFVVVVLGYFKVI
jgi:hypothetical protein